MNIPADEALRAELAGLLPPPEVPDLPPLRHQALKHRILNAAEGRAPFRSRRRVPRFALPAMACTAVVTAVALTVVSGESPVPPAPPHTGVAAPGSGQILTRAALAAAASPRAEARPEQFVYIESLVAHAARSAAGGPAALPPAHRRQVWLSADGSREGLLREQGAPDSPLGVRGPVYTLDHRGATPRKAPDGGPAASVLDPTHSYVASLPTDPDALLSLVYAQTRTTSPGTDPDQRAFSVIGSLLAETWAPPKVTAALYGAAARIPGTTVLPSAKDAAGREGVAVARTAHGEQIQWIFDRKSSAFLGQRTVLARATDAGPAGTVLSSTAVLARAVADRPGERPLGASAAPGE